MSLVLLEVADLEASVRFYRDVVGVPLHASEHATGDDRWISGKHAAYSWTDGAYLHFALYAAKDVTTTSAHVGFLVDDIEAAHARALAAGVEVLHEPRREPWGMTARYLDPDGNFVSFTQHGS